MHKNILLESHISDPRFTSPLCLESFPWWIVSKFQWYLAALVLSTYSPWFLIANQCPATAHHATLRLMDKLVLHVTAAKNFIIKNVLN